MRLEFEMFDAMPRRRSPPSTAAVVRELKERNRQEDRPITEKQVRSLAFRAVKRDNPDTSPEELLDRVNKRVEIGLKPTTAVLAKPARSPTARDLTRAARKALVKKGRHLR